MAFATTYRLRLRRKRLRLRAWRKALALRSVVDRTGTIAPDDILVFATLRNEAHRLPHFLAHYRAMGVRHFLIVDNDSSDGTAALLAEQSDVSVWHTAAGYRGARFGMDWMNALLSRHGHGHWCLTVDPDELFVFPFGDTRPLRALTDWLEASGTLSFSAMLIDLYPKGAIEAQAYDPAQDPLEVLPWFDAGNYRVGRNWLLGNLWIQGGPRARMFFAERPRQAPALNKIPLVRWDRSFTYVSSTHMLLPRTLNRVYADDGAIRASGALLHTKFLPSFSDKAREELERRQHYDQGREYIAYAQGLEGSPTFWTPQSTRYRDWRQLEELGLISRGGWA